VLIRGRIVPFCRKASERGVKRGKCTKRAWEGVSKVGETSEGPEKKEALHQPCKGRKRNFFWGREKSLRRRKSSHSQRACREGKGRQQAIGRLRERGDPFSRLLAVRKPPNRKRRNFPSSAIKERKKVAMSWWLSVWKKGSAIILRSGERDSLKSRGRVVSQAWKEKKKKEACSQEEEGDKKP